MTEGEGEGREKKAEELFEDLDSFFAPIQGADWPVPDETEEAQEAAPEGGPDERPMGASGPLDEPEVEAVGPTAEPEAEAIEPAGEGSFLQESLTEEELPPIEDEHLVSLDEGALEEVDLVEYAYDESAEGSGETEPATILIEDEGIMELSEEGDVEEAAAHFAGDPFHETPGDIEQNILSDLEAPEDEPLTVKVGEPEGLHGPSWQEPTSEEVGAEPAPSGGGRDLPAAVLTGVAMAAVALIALAAGRVWFGVVAGVVLLAAQMEFYAVITRRNHQPATALGLVTGALVLAGGYLHGEPGALAMFAIAIVFTFVWYMTTPVHHRVNVLTNIALTLFGVAWIPLLGSALLVVLRFEPPGRALVLGVLAMVFAYDTTAFAVGSLWGDHPLAPSVSPRKSREGAIAATIVVLIVALAGLSPIDGVELPGAILLAIAVAVLAPLGDLAESLVKRDLGIKDMGSVLPGHGGVLDRIDSVLLVAPAALIILRMVLLS